MGTTTSSSSSSSSTSICKRNKNKSKKKYIYIYDTWVRDGTQGESVSVSCKDKIKIASKLSQFNMDYIEAGWPGSNPKDVEFFNTTLCTTTNTNALSSLKKNKLTAFGST